MSSLFIHHGSLLGAWKRASPRCHLRKCRIHMRICWSTKDTMNVCHSFSSSFIPVEQCIWPDGGQQIRKIIIFKCIIYWSEIFVLILLYLARCGAHLHKQSQVTDLWMIWFRMFRVCGCLTCETTDPPCNPMISKFTPYFISPLPISSSSLPLPCSFFPFCHPAAKNIPYFSQSWLFMKSSFLLISL